ncbi:MAG: hypothetical protein IJ131_07010 [Eggerthellaceae bacterium]|nr:hypothetical protein [Eggerthellaceae bacterium]
MRDYVTMRNVLMLTAAAKGKLCFNDFRGELQDDTRLKEELVRLEGEKLLDADISLDGVFGRGRKCSVSGLTPEGRAFYRLIENDDVWSIVLETLRQANVDISYPLLKEVCEEIVKRYVTSFIPDIGGKG